MLFFGSRVAKLEDRVTESFARVREDTDVLFQWVHYLNAQQDGVRKAIDQMQQALQQVQHSLQLQHKQPVHAGLTVDDVRNLLAQQQGSVVNDVLDKVRHIENSMLDKVRHIEESIKVIGVKKPSLQERVAKSVMRHSKDYISNMIFSFIQKYGRISGLKLREIVVEEQGLCSKSSFYRILEDLERAKNLNVLVEGKEKVFVSSQEVFHDRK